MDPLSTFALVAAFLAPVPLTRRPDWNANKNVIQDHALNQGSSTTYISFENASETSILLPSVKSNYLDLGQALKQQIQIYAQQTDEWDGPGSVAPSPASSSAAMSFIDLVPGGLPLPTPMMTPKGEVGFYWDFQHGYADVSFAWDGLGSFFSRTKAGEEHYSENLSTHQFTRQWFFDAIGALSSPSAIAA